MRNIADYIYTNGRLISTDELRHYGVLGMKWGKRKNRYSSTSIRAAAARRSNAKIDKSFSDWKENAKKRDDAIELGKKRNQAKIAYENDKSDKNAKTAYKDADKQYKKALKSNTAYRKGVIRQEVGRDASKKYLSEAKKVKKQMTSDPTNKALQKKYNELMSKHDIERASARRAASVGEKRSRRKAGIKRSLTVAVKGAAATAAVAVGVAAVNGYLNSRSVTLDGKPVRVRESTLSGISELVKKGRDLLGYMY